MHHIYYSEYYLPCHLYSHLVIVTKCKKFQMRFSCYISSLGFNQLSESIQESP